MNDYYYEPVWADLSYMSYPLRNYYPYYETITTPVTTVYEIENQNYDKKMSELKLEKAKLENEKLKAEIAYYKKRIK